MNLLHHGANPQHALDLPRFCISPPKSAGIHASLPLGIATIKATNINSSVINLEETIPMTVVNKLKKMGHTCYVLKGDYRMFSFGRGNIIRIKKDYRTGKCVLRGGCDPRSDGQAAAVASKL